ncbi:MAG: hypothetical protein HC929_03950 [Leptolyngbyaceae cyanobacterium SM2_5_2]|nr:hypothetical protein [Leptolyngbyaceae cyanobacterium SM2_5_2]
MDESVPQSLLKSSLLNRLAINLDTAEEFGPITEVWVNGRTHQVSGLGCSGGLLGRQNRRFLWAQVASIGRDGVVIRAGAQSEANLDPLQDCLPLAEVEIWSDHGDRIGYLADYYFEPSTGNILQYLFVVDSSGVLESGLYAIPPIAIVSTGRRRMMVETNHLRAATPLEAETLPPPPTAARPLSCPPPLDHWPDSKRSWEVARETTRQAREQVVERFGENRQKLQTEAQDRLGRLFGNVKKRTRRLRTQLRETVTDVTAGLPSGSSLQDDTVPTIDVDAMELWADDDDETQL